MPMATPALELGADANAIPPAANAINSNFFMSAYLPQFLIIELKVRRKVALDYSVVPIAEYLG